jgi:hypothetical protein
MTPHTFKRLAMTGIAIAALSLPTAAHARVLMDPPEHPVPTPAAAPSQPAAASSFQWGDAGIGAAATIALLGGGVLAAGAVRRRRMPLPN